jgi:hypothetical protein
VSKPKLIAYAKFDLRYPENAPGNHKVVVVFGGVKVAEVDPISPLSIYDQDDHTDYVVAETVAHYLGRLFK